MIEESDTLSSALGFSDCEWQVVNNETTMIVLTTKTKSECLISCLNKYGIEPSKNAKKAVLAALFLGMLFERYKEPDKKPEKGWS